MVKGDRKRIVVDYTKYDTGYASVVFTKHKDLVDDFPFEIGGTGFDLEKELPYEIEHLMPDYSLYPENEYSMGFTTRGCVRKCEFCFVPEKEGPIRYNADIKEFYNPNLKKIMLLDNNILAYSGYKKVFQQIRDADRPTCFKQGMDFRLLTDDKVDELLSIRYDREFIFAYDTMKIGPVIEKQMNKFRGRFKDWQLKFFVLVGYNTSLEDDVFRILYLKNNKCLPYVMRYQDCYTSKYKDFYTDLAAWCNQVWAFKAYSFEEFLFRRYSNLSRIKSSFRLWKENT